jgi:hypothetical protein
MRFWKPISDFLHSPEWMAALVLFAQAVILFLQYKILARHGETMEKHTEIAGTQAKTAESIGKALEQQGKILGEQTKIMSAQFEFERRVAEQAERARVLSVVTDLRTRYNELIAVISKRPELGATLSPGTRAEQDRAWNRMTDAILPCQQALLTSIHLSQKQRNYFLGFANDLLTLSPSRTNSEHDIGTLEAMRKKYNDFLPMLVDSAQTPAV